MCTRIFTAAETTFQTYSTRTGSVLAVASVNIFVFAVRISPLLSVRVRELEYGVPERGERGGEGEAVLTDLDLLASLAEDGRGGGKEKRGDGSTNLARDVWDGMGRRGACHRLDPRMKLTVNISNYCTFILKEAHGCV